MKRPVRAEGRVFNPARYGASRTFVFRGPNGPLSRTVRTEKEDFRMRRYRHG